MATQYANGKIVTNGLVLSLDAADRNSYLGSGTSWFDLSNNGNTGTLINTPTFDSNQGGAIKFNATNNYVTVADSNSIDFNQSELTVSLWFNRGTILGPLIGDQQNLIIKGSSIEPTGDQLNYSVSLYGPTGGGYIRWANGALGGGSAIYSPSSQIFFENTWYNFCYTHVSGNAPMPYLNAVLQTNYTFTSGNAAVPFKANSFVLTLVGDGTRPAESSTALFNGRIAIVHLYNRALTASEILQNYNATKSRFGL